MGCCGAHHFALPKQYLSRKNANTDEILWLQNIGYQWPLKAWKGLWLWILNSPVLGRHLFRDILVYLKQKIMNILFPVDPCGMWHITLGVGGILCIYIYRNRLNPCICNVPLWIQSHFHVHPREGSHARDHVQSLQLKIADWGVSILSWLKYIFMLYLVGGWATPLKNMKVNWDD